MKKLILNGCWTMTSQSAGFGEVAGEIPGSVYSFLTGAGLLKDPYYRDNASAALPLMEHDYTFTRTFLIPKDQLRCRHKLLSFEGIDTIADVYLNGHCLGHTYNMHRTWEFPADDLCREGTNELRICLHSPTKYIREKDKEHHLGGAVEAMRGFPHLRKAHYMFGWDWGPRLPDQGIWRDVTLLSWDDVRIEDICIHQRILTPEGLPVDEVPDGWQYARSGRVRAELTVKVEHSPMSAVPKIHLTSPAGNVYSLSDGEAFTVPQPQLWWPAGLGAQPLYRLEVELGEGPDADRRSLRIGLRSATVDRKPDRWGESFAMMVNGRTFFAMGADYIPEDNILARRDRRSTDDLLQRCVDAHFNVIRVWGGGIYPDDGFYDLCDEKGLVVWQDLMFACANYRVTPAFAENITQEITQNVRRLRHHACLGLWCGNNEMEQFAMEGEFDGTAQTRADYLIQNEYIIPGILCREDPDTFYWPSSPSSGGHFDDPRDENRGDVHYWDVWHGGEPFTAYRSYYFRFLSEFGFQSFPCMETIRAFTEPQDRNVFSKVMEMHQRNSGANGKILQYLSQNYLYPGSFDLLVYASQLLQADAIRCGVEHLRRHRNGDRCMGAVYWQLNDCWPVASWSSIDYYHRPKALHFAAKRFFAPVLLSCAEDSLAFMGRTCISDPSLAPAAFGAALCVTNDTWETVEDTVLWQVRDPHGSVVKEGCMDVHAAPFTAQWCPRIDLSWIDPYEHHLYFALGKDGQSGTVLFVPPKHYHFADPKLQVSVDETAGTITVRAEAFAKSVEIRGAEVGDNFMDLEPGERTVRYVTDQHGKVHFCARDICVRSVYDIE